MVKNISHKEVRRRMKMNEMEEARHWVERLWEERSQKITWGLVAVAVLAVVIYLYMDSRQKSRGQAQALLGEALVSASAEEYDEALPLVNQITEQYSSSSIHPLALMLKGDILYAQEDFEGALEYYEQLAAAQGDQQMTPAAVLAIAACQESLQQEGEAEASYRRILQEHPGAAELEETRYLLARSLDRRGEKEEAVALYREIPEDSIWAAEARRRADWLETSPIRLTAATASTASVASTTPS